MERELIKGKKIRQSFKGGTSEEISLLRKAAWSNAVLLRPGDFTTEQVTKAETIRTQLLAKNDEIEALINEIEANLGF